MSATLRAVTGQIDWWWNTIFRPRLDGLGDDELFWEPVGRCWTLHPEPDGGSTVDFHWPPPNPTPFTTMAWRLAHIGTGCLAKRTALYFPEHAPEPWDVAPHDPTTPFPATADEIVAFLDRWWAAWRAGIDAAGEDGLWRPFGDLEGDFPEMQLGATDPFIGMVLHISRELMHHGAEINLLRDLYRAQQPSDPFVDAVTGADRDALARLVDGEPGIVGRYLRERPDLVLRATETGNREAVRLAVELGFEVDRRSPDVTALQHAIAGGHLDLVRALVELGADTAVKDPTYGADALATATFFRQDAVAEYLRAREG